jgi:signal transduction histidine kinase
VDSGGFRKIAPLHQGRRTAVWRAIQEPDEIDVVLKRPVRDNPPTAVWDAYRHEAEMLRAVRGPGVVGLRGLVETGTAPLLVMDDAHAQSLGQWVAATRPDWRTALPVALAIAEAVAAVHRHDVLHLAVQPGHVLVDPNGQVALVDFQRAQPIYRKEPLRVEASEAEGGLAYIAPEQTGRLTRRVDARADLYALGATLYYLFTGRPPFGDTSALALMHAHLARRPDPPSLVAPELPTPLSDLIVRLLQKEPDARYHSAAGVVADLTLCAAAEQKSGTLTSVVLGKADVPVAIPTASRLYGDDPVGRALSETWTTVRDGGSATMLIRGAPGSGKTTRLHQVVTRVEADAGLVVQGRFEPDLQSVPYAALLRMLEPVVARLLHVPDAELTVLRARLEHRLAGDVALLTDVPHWEALMGYAIPPEPLMTRVTPDLRRAITRLIETLAEDRPVVLAWDDVEWADTYSEGVMRELLATDFRGGLLLVATANLPDPPNPQDRVRAIWGTASGAHTVLLPSLDPAAVRTWLAETLHRLPGAVTELAQIISDRSQGSPRGVTELLDTLWREDGLYYDRSVAGWAWNDEQARQLEPRAPVLAGLLKQVSSVPAGTARLLRWAACLGARFDPSVLAAALNWPAHALGALEGELRGTGVVEAAPVEGRGRPWLRFVHPGVWEAIGIQAPEGERQEAHLALARVRHARRRPTDDDAAMYAVARHYNLAGPTKVVGDDRWAAAEANLEAARRAEAKGAWPEALHHSSAGVGWLMESAWEDHYSLALALYTARLTAQCARSDFAAAKATADEIRRHGASFVERARAYARLLEIWAAEGDEARVRTEGRAFLRDGGADLPESVTAAAVDEVFHKVRLRRAERDWPTWAQAPSVSDPAWAAVMHLVSVMAGTVRDDDAWTQHLELYGLDLALQHGFGPQAPGLTLAPLCRMNRADPQDLAEAYAWGELGQQLARRREFGDQAVPAVLPFLLRLAHFRQPHAEVARQLEELDRVRRDRSGAAGALLDAPALVVARLLAGEPLEVLLQRSEELIDEAGQVRALAPMWSLQRLAALFREWRGTPLPESVTLAYGPPRSRDDRILDGYLAAWDALLFDRPADAAKRLAPLREWDGRGNHAALEPEVRFMDAVAAWKGGADVDAERVGRTRAALAAWADASPANYRAPLLFLDAVAADRREDPEAPSLFAAAAAAAEAGGVTLVGAYMHEQAARAHRARGREWEALPHLLAAFRLYSRWGLVKKTRDLMACHPELDDFVAPAPDASDNLSIDLEAMVQTSTALAQEVQLDKLVGVLLETARTQAGAEHGALLLERSDGWWVEAITDAGDGNPFLPEPLSETRRVPPSLIRYVVRTGLPVRLDDAATDRRFGSDAYFRRHAVRSVLALPVVKQGQTLAVLYLDNGLVARAFPPDRVSLLQLWAGQAAVSIENARVYGELEARVAARTEDLAVALDTLRRAQRQMVEGEKMASLGQLTAGIAHEINNPVNFVASSVPSLRRDVEDLLGLLDLYAATVRDQDLTERFKTVQDQAAAIDLEYTRQEVAELLRGIEDGAQRTSEIVKGLRNFSRLDEDDVKLADVAEGIDSTLMLVKQQFEGRIAVEKAYSDVGPIECYPGQLNQVFMNLLVNAGQAIRGQGTIRISVEADQTPDPDQGTNRDDVVIRIADTGVGMTPEVQRRIFEPFFTTKAVGEGTGLGLSISYGIVERHRGRLSVESSPGAGTTFTIRLPRRQIVETMPSSVGSAGGGGRS